MLIEDIKSMVSEEDKKSLCKTYKSCIEDIKDLFNERLQVLENKEVEDNG